MENAEAASAKIARDELLQEYILLDFYTNLGWFLLWAAVCLACLVWTVFWFLRVMKANSQSDANNSVDLVIVGLIPCVGFFIGACFWGYKLAKFKIAPRVVAEEIRQEVECEAAKDR